MGIKSMLGKLMGGAEEAAPEAAEALPKAVPAQAAPAQAAPAQAAPAPAQAAPAQAAPAQAAPAPAQAAPQKPVDGALPTKESNINAITGKPKGYVAKSRPSTVLNVAHEMMINGMLSGPSTHVLNIGSGAFMAVTAPLDTLARAVTSKFNKGADQTSVISAVRQAQGMAYGFGQALRFAGSRLKSALPGQKESVEQTLTKYNLSTGIANTNRLEQVNRTISAKGLKLDENGIAGQVADVFGSLINLPGSAMNSADQVLKISHAGGAHYAWAADKVVAGEYKNFNEALTSLKNNPDMQARGVELGEYYTFQSKPNNKFLSAVTDSSLADVPGIRWAIPFKRSAANIADQTIERSPLVLLSPTSMRRLASSDPNIRATAQARLITGMTMTTVLGYALQDHLTGSAPRGNQNKDIFENVNGPENSLVFRDDDGNITKALRLDQMGVYGQFMKMIAGYTQWSSNQRKTHFFGGDEYAPDKQRLDKEFAEFVAPIVEVMWDTTWSKNIVEFSAVVQDAIDGNNPDGIVRFLERMGTNMLPGPGGAFSRASVLRDDPAARKAKRVGDTLRKGLERTAKLVPKSYSWNGKTQIVGKYKRSHVAYAKYDYNPNMPMERLFDDIGVRITEPNDFIRGPSTPMGKGGPVVPGAKIPLNQEEWEQLNEWHQTGIPEAGLPNLETVLGFAVSNKFFKQGPPGIDPEALKEFQKETIELVISDYRGWVYDAMKAQPSVSKRLKEAMQAKQMQAQQLGVIQ